MYKLIINVYLVFKQEPGLRMMVTSPAGLLCYITIENMLLCNSVEYCIGLQYSILCYIILYDIAHFTRQEPGLRMMVTSPAHRASLVVVDLFIYIYRHVHIYIYIYTHIERERDVCYIFELFVLCCLVCPQGKSPTKGCLCQEFLHRDPQFDLPYLMNKTNVVNLIYCNLIDRKFIYSKYLYVCRI